MVEKDFGFHMFKRFQLRTITGSPTSTLNLRKNMKINYYVKEEGGELKTSQTAANHLGKLTKYKRTKILFLFKTISVFGLITGAVHSTTIPIEVLYILFSQKNMM